MKRSRRRSNSLSQLVLGVMVAVALPAGAATAVTAQAKADLNGTWKLNPAKSKFASSGSPDLLTIRFETDGRTLHETLTIVHSGSQLITKIDYNLDGHEVVNHNDDEDVKTIARWDGSVLVLEWKDQGGTTTFRVDLQENGKTMTMAVQDSDRSVPSGDLLVLDKQ